MPLSASSAQLCPPEILSLIFSQFAYDLGSATLDFSLSPDLSLTLSTSTTYSARLLPLILICRNWKGAACEELYRNVQVARPGQLSTLVLNSTPFLPLIKHLRVLWNRQPWVLPFDPDLELIPVLLDAAPAISHMTLAGEQFNLSSDALLTCLAKRGSGTGSAPILGLALTSLPTPYIDQRFGPQGRRTSSVLDKLLEACPYLTEVRFDEFRSSYTTAPTALNRYENSEGAMVRRPSGIPTIQYLRSIALCKVVLESSYLGQLLSRLSSGGSLRELKLDRTSLGTVEGWKNVLTDIGHGLEVLSMTQCDFWATWPSEDSTPTPLIDHIFTSCPNLRQLTLLGSFDISPPSLTQKTAHSHLQVMTLVESEHLSLGRLRVGLENHMWMGLRELKVYLRGRMPEERNKIGRVCELLGVDCRLV